MLIFIHYGWRKKQQVVASNDEKLQPWKTIQQRTELGFGQCTAVSSSLQASFLKLKFKGRNTTSWLLDKAGKPVPRVTGTDSFNSLLIIDDGFNYQHLPYMHWFTGSPLRTMVHFVSIQPEEDFGKGDSNLWTEMPWPSQRSQADKNLSRSKSKGIFLLYYYNDITQQLQCCLSN